MKKKTDLRKRLINMGKDIERIDDTWMKITEPKCVEQYRLYLRNITQTINSMKCPQCGRHPILTSDTTGNILLDHTRDILIVCPHQYDKLPKRSKYGERNISYLGSSTLMIERFDDGPSRW